jgi:WS/DGAT/MGAT family acyltransferase
MADGNHSFHYDALSMTDYSMLVLENPTHPMHVAALAVFEPGLLSRPNGSVNFNEARQLFAAALHKVPRYRQKLLWQEPQQVHTHLRTPAWIDRLREHPPVWIDDADFDLDYHVRHMALPKPGNEAQLKTLVGQLVSTPLDRSRPLWESWIIEGMHSHRTAILIKVHHCMVDGISGIGLAQHLLSPNPDLKVVKPLPFSPRPAPSLAELQREDIGHKLKLSLQAAGELGTLLLSPARLWHSAETTLRSVRNVLGGNLVGQHSATPLNGELGLHRKVEWLQTSLKSTLKVKRAWHCSVNDVLLVVVTNALRQYLEQRGVDVDNTPFRVGMPVSIRNAADKSTGNQISFKVIDLPIAETSHAAQLQLIRAQTTRISKSSESLVVNSLMSLVEFIPAITPILARSFAATANCYMTNIPGPGFPLYQLGGKMVSIMPIAPLNGSMGLCIGAMSYNGKLFWGLLGDAQLVPDLALLAHLIQQNWNEIRRQVKTAKSSIADEATR